jgi:hypothetical protein
VLIDNSSGEGYIAAAEMAGQVRDTATTLSAYEPI